LLTGHPRKPHIKSAESPKKVMAGYGHGRYPEQPKVSNMNKRDRDPAAQPYFKTDLGRMYMGDCLAVLMEEIPESSVDLVVTSPPFGLVRKKGYGNVDADKYVEWFKPFGREFKRVLKPSGSSSTLGGLGWRVCLLEVSIITNC